MTYLGVLKLIILICIKNIHSFNNTELISFMAYLQDSQLSLIVVSFKKENALLKEKQ